MKQTYQVILNLVHTFDWKNNYPDEDEHLAGILADTDLSTKNMYHTMLQATPVQILFGGYIILNPPFMSDWEDIMGSFADQMLRLIVFIRGEMDKGPSSFI